MGAPGRFHQGVEQMKKANQAAQTPPELTFNVLQNKIHHQPKQPWD
jgi:hypothetical protein